MEVVTVSDELAPEGYDVGFCIGAFAVGCLFLEAGQDWREPPDHQLLREVAKIREDAGDESRRVAAELSRGKEMLLRTVRAPNLETKCVDVSARGQRVAIGGFDIHVWSTHTGELEFASGPLEEAVSALRLSPGGSHLAVADEAGSVSIWSVERGDRVLGPIVIGVDDCSHLEWSLDGALLSIAGHSGSGRVSICSTRGVASVRAMVHPGGEIESIGFSSDGRYVVAAGRGITVWDSSSGLVVGMPLGPEDWIRHAEFSRDGQELGIIDDYRGTLRIWKTDGGGFIGETDFGLSHVAELEFIGDPGYWMVTDGVDVIGFSPGLLGVTGSPLKRDGVEPLGGDRPWLGSNVSISADGKWLAVPGAGGLVRVWDLLSGKGVGELYRHGPELVAVGFDGACRLVTAGGDGVVRIWDFRQSEDRASLPYHPSMDAWFSDSGNHFVKRLGHAYLVAIRGDSGLFECATQARPIEIMDVGVGGESMVVVDDLGCIGTWDLLTGEWRREALRPRGDVLDVALERHGDRLGVLGEFVLSCGRSGVSGGVSEELHHGLSGIEYDDSGCLWCSDGIGIEVRCDGDVVGSWNGLDDATWMKLLPGGGWLAGMDEGIRWYLPGGASGEYRMAGGGGPEEWEASQAFAWRRSGARVFDVVEFASRGGAQIEVGHDVVGWSGRGADLVVWSDDAVSLWDSVGGGMTMLRTGLGTVVSAIPMGDGKTVVVSGIREQWLNGQISGSSNEIDVPHSNAVAVEVSDTGVAALVFESGRLICAECTTGVQDSCRIAERVVAAQVILGLGGERVAYALDSGQVGILEVEGLGEVARMQLDGVLMRAWGSGRLPMTLDAAGETVFVGADAWAPLGGGMFSSVGNIARRVDLLSGLVCTEYGDVPLSIVGAEFSADGTILVTWRESVISVWDGDGGGLTRSVDCEVEILDVFLDERGSRALVWGIDGVLRAVSLTAVGVEAVGVAEDVAQCYSDPLGVWIFALGRSGRGRVFSSRDGGVVLEDVLLKSVYFGRGGRMVFNDRHLVEMRGGRSVWLWSWCDLTDSRGESGGSVFSILEGGGVVLRPDVPNGAFRVLDWKCGNVEPMEGAADDLLEGWSEKLGLAVSESGEVVMRE